MHKPDNNQQILLIAGISVLWALVVMILYPAFTGDDSFIHLAFINSMAESGKFAFAGNVTNGSTAPLWVLLNSFLALTGIDPYWIMRTLSLMFGMGVLVMVFKIARYIRLDGWLLWSVVIISGLNAYFMRWGFTGMETTAAMFFLLAGTYLLLTVHNNSGYALIGLCFGAGTLLRPEIFLFFLLLVFHQLFLRKKLFYGEGLTQSGILLISGILPILLWSIYAFNTFGSVLPNTFDAKTGSGLLEPSFHNLERNLKLMVSGNFPEIIAIAGMAGLLLFSCSPGNIKNQIGKNLMNFLKSGKGLVFLWFIGFYGYYTGKDVIILSRYALLLMPFVVLFTGWLISQLQKNTCFSGSTNMIATGWLISAILFHGFFTFAYVKPASDKFASGFQQTYTEMANILSEKNLNGSVALTDVGIIGLKSRMKIYDLAGLTDHRRFDYEDAASYVQAKKPTHIILREDYEIEVLLDEKAEFEVIFENHIPGFGINEPEYRYVRMYEIRWH